MPSAKEASAKWRAENPGYHAKWQRENRKRNPGAVKRNNLKQNYGLSLEQYEFLVAQQGSRCAICQKIPARLCVDHSHSTGLVRSLLCSECNAALGLLQEDPARIRALADYAEKFKER